MNHPSFDPKQWTDQQLTEKIQELNKRLTAAQFYGMSHQMYQQVWNLLSICENEYYERNTLNQYWETEKNAPDSIIIGEDDPYAEEDDSEQSEQKK